MTAPTAEEIHEAIIRRLGEQSAGSRGTVRATLAGVADDAAGPLSWPAEISAMGQEQREDWGGPPTEGDDYIWWDLRPSEGARMLALINDAIARATERCEAIILEELTAAGVQFAAEHPDAPRPREKVPA